MRAEELDTFFSDGSQFKQRDHLEAATLACDEDRVNKLTPRCPSEYSSPIPAAYARPQPRPTPTARASDPDGTYYSSTACTRSDGAGRT
jgi:hypothetical protein